MKGADVLPIKQKPAARNGKTAGRFASINNFVDHTLRDLTANEAIVWFVLWKVERNGIAKASHDDIAERAGVNPRTVRRGLRSLLDKGLIDITKPGGLRLGPNTYRIHSLRAAVP